MQHSAVLEGPLDNIGVRRGALNPLALLQLAPELGEVLQFQQVPDIAGVSFDDCGLANRGGRGNRSGHFGGTIE